MFIIKASIGKFNYWLQEEVKGYKYYWNGLINNATKFHKEDAISLLSKINSPWRLSIENV